MIEIIEDNKIIESINFERIEVGTVLNKEYMIRNNSHWKVENIQVFKKDEDLNIQFPTELKGNELNKLSIQWNPKIDRRIPLTDEITITGIELIG